MTILVTGAAGFIGSALCRRLLERGDTVVGLDNHNGWSSAERGAPGSSLRSDIERWVDTRRRLGQGSAFPDARDRRPMRIDGVSLDQLLALNDLICRRIDELQARQEMDVLSRLRLGQLVFFESREGQVFGRVIKINCKTVLVQSEDRRQWKVAVALLQPLHDV